MTKKLTTISRSIDAIQAAEEVLQEILTDLTLEWFTAPREAVLGKTGRRILDVGILLYDKPHDFLHICLWEALEASHPETNEDVLRLRALFRSETWNVAEAVHEDTKWDQFESFVMDGVPAGSIPPRGAKVISII